MPQAVPSITNNVWAPTSKATAMPVALDADQAAAVRLATASPVSIITGAAGTGKSVVVKALTRALEKTSYTVSRTAPTGRAAQIINGTTIHAWLLPVVEELPGDRFNIIGYQRSSMGDKECLIIDESSMLDDVLWDNISTIYNRTTSTFKKLVLVGDPHQLEPVGPGAPFLKMVRARAFPTVRLTTVHRSREASGILKLARTVQQTRQIDLARDYTNVHFVTAETALTRIVTNPDVQLITPRRTGPTGTLALNNTIKAMMQRANQADFCTLVWSDAKKRFVQGATVHRGDKVIVTRNLWQWNVTNGTIGIYEKTVRARIFNHIKGQFSNARATYKFRNPTTGRHFHLPANTDMQKKLELAYAITVHKAQGSEYRELVLYLPNGNVPVKMLYTAVTRAKTKLLIYHKHKLVTETSRKENHEKVNRRVRSRF